RTGRHVDRKVVGEVASAEVQAAGLARIQQDLRTGVATERDQDDEQPRETAAHRAPPLSATVCGRRKSRTRWSLQPRLTLPSASTVATRSTSTGEGTSRGTGLNTPDSTRAPAAALAPSGAAGSIEWRAGSMTRMPPAALAIIGI